MFILLHILSFFFGCGVLWFSSDLITKGVESFAKNLKISSFIASFLILGILTSVTEISVGFNAILDNKPGIFVGNLIGSSFVMLVFIIPLLAIFNNGIAFKQHFNEKKALFFIILLLAPSLLVLDGQVSRYDAILVILLYTLFFFYFKKHHNILEDEKLEEKISQNATKKEVIVNLGKIIVGAIFIYFASNLLVDKTIYFAEILEVPPFLVSLLILSLGTNLPELAITINSIYKKHPEIALGDYIGSAAANPFLFGIFTLLQGPFTLQSSHFNFTFLIILIGYILLFVFFRSKNTLSFLEGVFLIFIYILFLLFQGNAMFNASQVI